VTRFLRAGERLVAVSAIVWVDCARAETLEVALHHAGGVDVARGPDAIEALMALKPSALEGRRMRFARRAWAVHNLVGHPVMQLLAWMGLRELGLGVHEATVPRPRG
jgi:hypothetical protein